jgi:hypothetical protein
MDEISVLKARLDETEKKLEDAEKRAAYHKREHELILQHCSAYEKSIADHNDAGKKLHDRFALFLKSVDNDARWQGRNDHHLRDPTTVIHKAPRKAKTKYEDEFPLPIGWSNLGKYTCNPGDHDYVSGPFKTVTMPMIQAGRAARDLSTGFTTGVLEIEATEGWVFYSRDPVEKTVSVIDAPGQWCLRADPAVRDRWKEDEKLLKEQRNTDRKRARLV